MLRFHPPSRSPGEPEWPLRLIVVGHNPSEKAWELGHYYANPSNRMWKLLSAAGIVPPGLVASDDDDCPIKCGVGFTDVVRRFRFDVPVACGIDSFFCCLLAGLLCV